eukprot:g17584.t1
MGKKAPRPAAGDAVGDELLEQGDALLTEKRFREAYQCFLEASTRLPTKQVAWFNLGLAASELWQVEGGEELLAAIALFLTALGALGQGVPLLWQQDTMLSMLQEKERSALSGSGFARWCLMAHQGCLHLMIAAISIMAALLYAPWQGKRKTFGPWFDLLDQAVQELFFLHVLLFIYNGSAIVYHRKMWRDAGGGKAPKWFEKEDTFWFNVYAIIFSSATNAVGVLAAYLQMR